MRIASIIKGKLTVAQEQDSLRHRTVLFARLHKWSAASGRAHELEQQLIGLGLVPVAPGPR